MRGRSRCSWCSSDLAVLMGLDVAMAAGALGTRARQLALRRAWIAPCLRTALATPALRSGCFSADDVR